MRNRYWIGVSVCIFALLGACAKPHVVQAVRTDDLRLNCAQLKGEIDKANAFRADAQKAKGVTGANVLATLFFTPGVNATYANANEAIAAADARAAHLSNLYVSKRCTDAQVEQQNAKSVLNQPLASTTPSAITQAQVGSTAVAQPMSFAPASSPSVAAVNDVSRLPLLDERSRDAYRNWLTRSPPRAFAICSNKTIRATWGLRPSDKSLPIDPAERAIFLGQQTNGVTCKLYAVDNEVVWK